MSVASLDVTILRRYVSAQAAAVCSDARLGELVSGFCRSISAVWGRAKRSGLPVDDAGGFAVAAALLTAPAPMTEAQLTDFCAAMRLASRKRVRALIQMFRDRGLATLQRAADDARRMEVHPTAELRRHFRDWISELARLAAPWTPGAPVTVDDALVTAYLRITAAAYLQGFVLQQDYPIVEWFMDRRSGYSLFLELVGAANASGESTFNRTRFAADHATSRPHVATLLREVETRGWLARGAKDVVRLTPETLQQGHGWIAAEIALASFKLSALTGHAAAATPMSA